MSRVESWVMHVATGLVGVTGLIYGVMRYFVRSADPYAVVNHPWQPTMQHLHILCAPLLVLAFGLIWRQHIWVRWRSGESACRRSGLAQVALFAPMVLSGYLIQTSVDELWRWIWVIIHGATSLLWLLSYAIHQIQAWRNRGATDSDPS